MRRILGDLGIGLLLAFVGQFAQMAASAVGRALGLPFPYEMAPEDGSIPPALLTQISLTFVLAAVAMFLVSLVIGWLLKVPSVARGAARGAVWMAVVALSQFLLGLGEGVVPVFGLVGVWVYLAAILLGPVIAGLLQRSRSTPGRSEAAAGGSG